ncbi:hypothetical protein MUU53_04140, partial [Rhizobium lemnae]|uniref:hypothetical protein n=1 Tax=Rhizobium lemnae TaxID=1214924 RepID=UPI001FF18489
LTSFPPGEFPESKDPLSGPDSFVEVKKELTGKLPVKELTSFPPGEFPENTVPLSGRDPLVTNLKDELAGKFHVRELTNLPPGEFPESTVPLSGPDTLMTDVTKKGLTNTSLTSKPLSLNSDMTASPEKQGFVGYDTEGNPLYEDSLKGDYKPGALTNQKVDEEFASRDLNKMFDYMSGNKRLNSEFTAYFYNKYKDKESAPPGMDIYSNPQNYTIDQKMKRYHDLMKLKGEFEGFIDYRKAPHTGTNALLLNEREARRDIDEAMTTLMEDPDTAAAMTAEYLTGYKEILAGKRFQEPGKYDAEYDKLIGDTKLFLQDELKRKLVDGDLYAAADAQGANEVSTNARFKTTLSAYSSVLDPTFVDSLKDQIGEKYNQFYSEKIGPKTANDDIGSNYKAMLYAYNTANMTPEERRAIGLLTPVVDGSTYKDTGKSLETNGWMNTISKFKLDEESKKLASDLGIDKSLKDDGVNAVYLKTAANVAEQLYGKETGSKADRGKFVSTLLTELSPLASQSSWEKGGETLNAKLSEIQTRLIGQGSTEADAKNLTTALNGIVRGSGLTNSTLLNGMYRAGLGFDLKDVQSFVTLATGYEGKGLAMGNVDPTASKVFGTLNRSWESGAINKFGAENLARYTDKMAGDFRSLFTDGSAAQYNRVVKPLANAYDMTPGFKKEILDPLASSMAEGLYGSDEAAKAKFMTNVPNLLHMAFSTLKPGGTLQTAFKDFKERITNPLLTIDDKPGVTLDDKSNFMAKAMTTFIAGGRTIYNGIMNGENMTPSAIAYTAIQSAQAFGYTSSFIGSQVKPGVRGGYGGMLEARYLASLGNYSDAARKVVQQIAPRVGGGLVGLTDVAFLPANIQGFVDGLKKGSLDTTEKVLYSVALAADTGVAVDGAMNLTRALTTTRALQFSRLGGMFFGAGGAVMGGLGAAFNVISAAGYIGMGIYQNLKEHERANKMTDKLEKNLSDLTGNVVRPHLSMGGQWYFPPTYGGTTEADLAALREKAYYKEDQTFVDWNAIREANRKRYAQESGMA